jgi:putative tryptophan/tyrosine transport system substrate-binding protein
MNRRSAILLVVALLLALPAASQPAGKVWRVGFIALTAPPPESVEAFRTAMRDLGYVEGRNLVVEWRSADGNIERIAELAVRYRIPAVYGGRATSRRAAS